MRFRRSLSRRLRRAAAAALCAVLPLGLFGCGAAASSEAAQQALDPVDMEDASFVLSAPTDPEAATLQNVGATIAFVADAAGLETGLDASVWRGVQNFAATFGYTAQSYQAEADTDEARETALRSAAESGAAVVVCSGQEMAVAVHAIQGNYPTVGYLLLEGEPHSADYTSYETASNTHCVLFSEEQAGYLAGYAAVMEGYTALGFVGADSMPETVRYCTGMIQGAEAAAEQEGEQVRFEVWYVGSPDAGDAVTARMGSWYTDGVQAIAVCGGQLLDSCLTAAQDNGGRVINLGWDATAQNDAVLTSGVLNGSVITQQQLYAYFTGGWGENAGKTQTATASEAAVSLPMSVWKFQNFSREAYRQLYGDLAEGVVRVERYSDTATLPETPNVAVDIEN